MTKTGYEIIGMIKEGNAPKKIRFGDFIYDFNPIINDYENDGIQLDIIQLLNDDFEITEEPKNLEIKTPKYILKDLGIINNYVSIVGKVYDKNIEEYIHNLYEQQTEIIYRLNEVIRYILIEKDNYNEK